jgi:c-di-GMP-binding flagellar brake protein YcgR
VSAVPDPAPQEDTAPPTRRPTDLQLMVGTVLNLQVLSERGGPRVQARVLGYLEGQSVIAALPGATLLPTDLRLGDEIAVRYLVGRSVCGFKTRVIRVSTSPYPYFHLLYPDDVQRMDVRSAERVQVALPARLDVGTQALDVEVRDLSATGAMLSTPREVGQVGDAVKLSMELTFGEITRQVSTAATIRNTAPAPEGGEDTTLRYGVQFDGLSEADHIFVRGFVFEQLASRAGVAPQFAPTA